MRGSDNSALVLITTVILILLDYFHLPVATQDIPRLTPSNVVLPGFIKIHSKLLVAPVDLRVLTLMSRSLGSVYRVDSAAMSAVGVCEPAKKRTGVGM